MRKRTTDVQRHRTEIQRSSVVIRVYSISRGNCCLVILQGQGRPFQILIDCGSQSGLPNAASVMATVAENIIISTGGYIDLLCVTNASHGCVSGFVQARDSLSSLRVGAVWLPWSADPSAGPASDLSFHQAVRGDLETTISLGLDCIRALVQPQDLHYCRPSDAPYSFDVLPNFRFYVLSAPDQQERHDRMVMAIESVEFEQVFFIPDVHLGVWSSWEGSSWGKSGGPANSVTNLFRRIAANDESPLSVTSAQTSAALDSQRK